MSATTVITSVNPRRTPSRKRVQITRLLPRPLLILINVVLCAIVLAPVSYLVLASVNSDLAVAGGAIWPKELHLENYVTVWTAVPLGKGLMNSLLICGSVAVVCSLVSLSTAWVLVRFSFLGRLSILRGLVGLQSVPGTLMLLPVFVVFSTLSSVLQMPTVGTRWSVFVAYLTFVLPFCTWIMVTYVRGLPRELEEAARMDGAGNVRVLLKIVLPLSWPGLVVSAIFAFLQGWNDVMFASVFTNRETQTAAVVLQTFSATQESGALPLYGQMMTASIICAAPVVVLYLVFQRYLVGGLTAGGVK
jgi:ABC-type glycerol-3-phosphate transport system permease component